MRSLGGGQWNSDAQGVFRLGLGTGQFDGHFRVHRNVLADAFREQVPDVLERDDAYRYAGIPT